MSTAPDRLRHPAGTVTIGLELPLDNDWGPARLRRDQAAGRPSGVPDLSAHTERARLADRLGFAALWVRDVPLYDPARFGDAGSVFETFTHLGHLSAVTERAVLGTAAVVLPLRKPLLVAKAAATVDQLSGGRFVLVGFLGGRNASLDVLSMLYSQAAIRGIAVGHRRAFLDTNAWIERNGLEPVIDTVYAFEDAHQAYEHLARGAFGKIVIRVAD